MLTVEQTAAADSLLDCPFCAGPPELYDLGAGTGGYCVRCRKCESVAYGVPLDPRITNLNNEQEAHAMTRVQAIRKWNRRVAPPLSAEPCPRCKGTGKVMVPSFVDSSKEIENSCSVCKGRGTLSQPLSRVVTCPKCGYEV